MLEYSQEVMTMFSIDKEKFGAFVAQLRKEKGLMQKELAEKLYVSDKAVSKWERGLSIPDVALLVPLSEILGVTVTELLEGRRISKEEAMDSGQTEQLVQKVIGMTAEENKSSRPKLGWWLLGCIAIGGAELWMLTLLGIPWEELLVSVGIVMLLMAIFGLHFCVFAQKQLPKYYDENRISSYSDGFFRMNMPGFCFNNNNWPYILKIGQLWCLLGLTLTPAAFFLFRSLVPQDWQGTWMYVVLALTLGGLFVPMTIVGRRYEFGDDAQQPLSRDWRDSVWILVIAALVGYLLLTGSFGTGSGLKVGWSEQKGLNSWSASYSYYNGWRQRTLNWNGEAEILFGEVHTEAGQLGITVTDQEGNILFSRENMGSESFEIPIEGKIGVRMTANGHQGSIFLRWQ